LKAYLIAYQNLSRCNVSCTCQFDPELFCACGMCLRQRLAELLLQN
jgi:hypothetical protein